MSTIAGRAGLRGTRASKWTPCRYASTTSEATQAATNTATKAKDSASTVTSKASQGLSKVTSSAGPALSGAAQGVSGALRRVGGRTGRFIGFVESMVPPAIYYSRVGTELAKLVFKGQKMYPPPSLHVLQSWTQPITHALRNPRQIFSQTTTTTSNLSPERILNQIRSVDRQQLVAGGVILAELVGFFSVGEIIGRFKLVGYRGDTEHHETATPH